MTAKLKIDLDRVLKDKMPVVLELGCGRSRVEGRIHIDKADLPNVDIVADIEDGLPFLPDDSIDEIHSTSFLEHVDDLETVVREISRVLKREGRGFISVPHFSNPYFYSDYTHKHFIGLYTLYYFVDERFQLKRKVHTYYTDIRIRVLYQHLVIATPGKRFSFFKRFLEFVFNLNSWLQEFYEANLCYIFPCYGIRFVIAPDKPEKPDLQDGFPLEGAGG